MVLRPIDADIAWCLFVGVGEAVSVVDPRAHVDFGCLAHQMVVVGAFGTLAGADVGKHLGEPAVHPDVDEGRAGGVVFSAADGNGGRVAVGVIVEGAIAHAAVGYVRRHWISSMLRPPRTGGAVVPR